MPSTARSVPKKTPQTIADQPSRCHSADQAEAEHDVRVEPRGRPVLTGDRQRQVVAQPGDQRHVPAAPELAQGIGGERPPEVLGISEPRMRPRPIAMSA